MVFSGTLQKKSASTIKTYMDTNSEHRKYLYSGLDSDMKATLSFLVLFPPPSLPWPSRNGRTFSEGLLDVSFAFPLFLPPPAPTSCRRGRLAPNCFLCLPSLPCSVLAFALSCSRSLLPQSSVIYQLITDTKSVDAFLNSPWQASDPEQNIGNTLLLMH